MRVRRHAAAVAIVVLSATAVVATVQAASAEQVAPSANLAGCPAPSSVMQDWIAAWKAKKFRRMVALSQVSWRSRTSDAAGLLDAQYGFKDVLSYRFVRCASNSVTARVTYRVRYRTFKVSDVLITGNVIREDASGHPSATGRWGVNPISTLREKPVG